MRINSLHYNIILLLFLLMGICAHAQEDARDVVFPMQASRHHPVIYDIYLYGAGGYRNHGRLTASNTENVKDTYLDIGMEVEAHKGSLLWLGATFGYKYECFAYDSGFSFREGVQSHWLSTSASANCNIWGLNYGIGVASDLFLGSRINNSEYFCYDGLNSECFNLASFGLYFGASIKLGRLKIEGRIGNYCKPQLNPTKIAYYNLRNAHVNGLYWEVKVSYRIFTSGMHYSNLDMLE